MWGGDGHLPCPDGLEACGLSLCQACCRPFPEHPGPQQEGPSSFLLLPPPSPYPTAKASYSLVSFLLQPDAAPVESKAHSLASTAPSGSLFVLGRPLIILGP